MRVADCKNWFRASGDKGREGGSKSSILWLFRGVLTEFWIGFWGWYWIQDCRCLIPCTAFPFLFLFQLSIAFLKFLQCGVHESHFC